VLLSIKSGKGGGIIQVHKDKRVKTWLFGRLYKIVGGMSQKRTAEEKADVQVPVEHAVNHHPFIAFCPMVLRLDCSC